MIYPKEHRIPLCIIPAGGMGTRMHGEKASGVLVHTAHHFGVSTGLEPKCLMKPRIGRALRDDELGEMNIGGMIFEESEDSVIQMVYKFWAPHCEEVVIIAPPGMQEEFWSHDGGYFRSHARRQNVGRLEIHEASSGRLLSSIEATLKKKRVPETFMVALGDCICDGEFNLGAISHSRDHGIATMEDPRSDWGRSYAVGMPWTESPAEFIEKPLLGLGYYFFNWTVMEQMENSDGMTDLLNNLARAGHKIRNVPFKGDYLNVTYPEDLTRWKPLKSSPTSS